MALQTNTPEVEVPYLAHVRFGSKADIARCQADVRFTPKSGHQVLYQGELGCDADEGRKEY